MNKIFLFLVLLFSICAGVLVYQVTHATKAFVYLPSEVVKYGKGKDLLRIRLGGKVAQEGVAYTLEPEISLAFNVEDPDAPRGEVPVVYKGLKPDMFAPGRSVLIDGDYVGGKIVATKLLTQCPSKYEPPLPQETAR